MDNSRLCILKSAIELFLTYGFSKTSMEEIARMAHKSKGTLYKNFRDKEEIMRYLVADDIKEIKQKLSPVLPAFTEIPKPEDVKIYLKQRMNTISTHPLFKFMLLSEDTQGNYYFLEDLKSSFNIWEYNLLKEYFDKVRQKNSDVSPAALADMFCMIMKGLEHQFFVLGKYREYSKTYETMVDLITDSITNKLKI